jgi:hypothetical protein
MARSLDLTSRPPQSRFPGLQEDIAIEKLLTTSTLCSLRGFYKQNERKKITEALRLVSVEERNFDKYQQFLLKVKDLSGEDDGETMVKLCAVALGKDAIKRTREHIRLILPQKIADAKDKLITEDLKNVKETKPDGL